MQIIKLSYAIFVLAVEFYFIFSGVPLLAMFTE